MQAERLSEQYTHDSREAHRILNSYYRFLALNGRLNYLENDSYWHDKSYTKEQAERHEKWMNRLQEWLSPYGLTLFRPWSTYFIERIDNSETVIEPYFYR